MPELKRFIVRRTIEIEVTNRHLHDDDRKKSDEKVALEHAEDYLGPVPEAARVIATTIEEKRP